MALGGGGIVLLSLRVRRHMEGFGADSVSDSCAARCVSTRRFARDLGTAEEGRVEMNEDELSIEGLKASTTGCFGGGGGVERRARNCSATFLKLEDGRQVRAEGRKERAELTSGSRSYAVSSSWRTSSISARRLRIVSSCARKDVSNLQRPLALRRRFLRR